MKITPVILSGGVGSRLWPLSRTALPKQFHKLGGDHPMFVETILRVKDDRFAEPLVVSNREHRFLVAEALRQSETDAQGILLEPIARDTAPAVAIAAYFLSKIDPESILLILPCDHLIRDVDAFYSALDQGVESLKDGHLVTFGMTPTKPETGYGYIQKGPALTGHKAVFDVAGFKEKPDLEVAEAYLKSGDYLWNSGMFLFRADHLLAELMQFEPELVKSAQEALDHGVDDMMFKVLSHNHFSTCKSISIDYALWENTQKAVTVPVDCGWSDVGSWESLYEISDSDEEGNVFDGTVLHVNSQDCYVRSDEKLVSLCGVENLAVVASKDAVLVMDKSKSQDVKKIVNQIKDNKMVHADEQPRMYRPWGWYETIDEGERFKVKHIYVKPGASLSLQKHHHRAEHWVVVSGSATVTCGTQEQLMSENQSIYIPIGETHRLENNGVIPLRLIEVQTGSYLGEDDIVRFEDRYQRHEN